MSYKNTSAHKTVILLTVSVAVLWFSIDLSSAGRNRIRNNCVWSRCSRNPITCPMGFTNISSRPCKRQMRMRTQCCRNNVTMSTTESGTGTTMDPESSSGPPLYFLRQQNDIPEFPQQVALVRQDSPNGLQNVHFCDGTIYDEDFIITSATCVMGDTMSPSNIHVHAADTNLNTFDGTEQIVPVGQIIIHENYVPTATGNVRKNDIALLKLADPLVITNNGEPSIYATALPIPGSNFDPSTTVLGQVGGWQVKQLFVQGEKPSLQLVEVPIYPGRTCGSSCELCVASDDWHENCVGGSGGTLVCKNGNINYSCGVSSITSTSPTVPSVYTDLSCYGDWIKMNVAMNSVKFHLFYENFTHFVIKDQ